MNNFFKLLVFQQLKIGNSVGKKSLIPRSTPSKHFTKIRTYLNWVILLTDRQTDRQTEKPINQQITLGQKHNLCRVVTALNKKMSHVSEFMIRKQLRLLPGSRKVPASQ